MSKKRAAFIVTEYNEKVFYGGGEKVNSYVVNELLNRNYSVDIYADISYVKKSELVNIFIKDENFQNNYESLLKDYNLILSTNIEYAADITYSHNHSYVFEKQLLKIPCFYSKKSKLEKFYNARKNIEKVSKIVVSSNIVKYDYLKNYNIPKEKLFVLPPGVDLREKSIELPCKNCFVFGLVARGFENKGGYITLFAINKLKKYCRNFKVRIINKNARKNLFISFLVNFFGLKKYVEFLPLQEDMTDFYRSINCLIAPSKKEPFGLIVTEAMSFSKPVILSSIVGAKDLIIDGVNGFVYDGLNNNCSELLADKMKKIINFSESEYIQISENAWNTVKNMSYEKFAKDYIDLAEEKSFTNQKNSDGPCVLSSDFATLRKNKKVEPSYEYKMLHEVDED